MNEDPGGNFEGWVHQEQDTARLAVDGFHLSDESAAGGDRCGVLDSVLLAPIDQYGVTEGRGIRCDCPGVDAFSFDNGCAFLEAGPRGGAGLSFEQTAEPIDFGGLPLVLVAVVSDFRAEFGIALSECLNFFCRCERKSSA